MKTKICILKKNNWDKIKKLRWNHDHVKVLQFAQNKIHYNLIYLNQIPKFLQKYSIKINKYIF